MVRLCCKLQELDRDEDGYYSFHEVQRAIEAYREDRIKNYKLVYPKVTSGDATSKKKLELVAGTTKTYGQSKKISGRRRGKVSSSVACPTMFQFNKGQTNPDVITQVHVMCVV